MISLERLKSQVEYDPDTGIFTWLVSKQGRKNKTLGCRDKDGYLICHIDRKMYKVHRLAWYYVHGAWPVGQIDHKNSLRDDNRLCNLRDVTGSQNQYNRKRRKDNKWGLKGISYLNGKWTASIKHNRKSHHLGVFSSPEEAHKAYCQKAEELYGEFWRPA